MKVLVIGSDGFIGSNVVNGFREAGYDTFGVSRKGSGSEHVDLLDPASIDSALSRYSPDVIVSCAGIVVNDPSAHNNEVFTRNILDATKRASFGGRVVVMGSAAEYGIVDSLPVAEDAPRNATNDYGTSKIKEVDLAVQAAGEGRDVVVARLFNPIGDGMPPRQLIPGVLRQLEEIKNGERECIEIGRRDGPRDYIDVRDVARAVVLLATSPNARGVYNVGSGVSTTNGELVEAILDSSGINPRPEVVDTMPNPEPQFASQADITRLEELGWSPQHTIQQVIERFMHA